MLARDDYNRNWLDLRHRQIGIDEQNQRSNSALKRHTRGEELQPPIKISFKKSVKLLNPFPINVKRKWWKLTKGFILIRLKVERQNEKSGLTFFFANDVLFIPFGITLWAIKGDSHAVTTCSVLRQRVWIKGSAESKVNFWVFHSHRPNVFPHPPGHSHAAPVVLLFLCFTLSPKLPFLYLPSTCSG